MPIPNYKALMPPTLKVVADVGAEVPLAQLRDFVAESEGIAAEDRRETVPSGRQTKFDNRVSWAASALARAGLLERPRRGVYQLTPEGKQLLSRAPRHMDRKLLLEYPAFAEWSRKDQPSSQKADVLSTQVGRIKETPEERIDGVIQQLNSALETSMLDRVHRSPPGFFEKIVVDLLVATGYDGAKGLATCRSHDGGIEGKIREDALGLDEVFVQAKRHGQGNKVGGKDLRVFLGAIDVEGATKGVFVTTSSFSPSATDIVKKSSKKIVLIDGAALVRLMVLYGVGVRVQNQYEIKRIDEGYFDPEA